MNYPANTEHLQVGMLALHDCDAKEPRMLMQVQGVRPKDGAYKMRYVHPVFHAEKPESAKQFYYNSARPLLDPAGFGVVVTNNGDGTVTITCDPAKGTISYADGVPGCYPADRREIVRLCAALPVVERGTGKKEASHG